MQSKSLEEAYSLALMELEKNLANFRDLLEKSTLKETKLNLAQIEQLWQQINAENAQTCGSFLAAYLTTLKEPELLGQKKKPIKLKASNSKSIKKAP